MAVGVYSTGPAAVVGAGLLAGRLPRAKPEPRLVPNEGAGAGVPAGCGVAVASAGAPDVSVDDMSMLLVESACRKNGGAGWNASRSTEGRSTAAVKRQTRGTTGLAQQQKWRRFSGCGLSI
jgi:hypothetical protein